MRKLVLQSDFGLGDGAVSAMKGIAYGVSENLVISDLTHDITPFNVWEASYRLFQVVDFWPEGTVFVSVVDPGVGSARKSLVARLSGDKYLVTPDNGTLTHLSLSGKITAVREIDETVNRLEGSEKSHTFHGRDVYAYTAARLAGGHIDFEGVGKELDTENLICIEKPAVEYSDGILRGTVEILDVRFGHLWTDISASDMELLNVPYGKELKVKILHGGEVQYENRIPFCKSFSDVAPGDKLVYINSMMNAAVAIHQESFSETFGIGSGVDWTIKISKA